MKPVVKLNNVSKTYGLFKKKSDRLLDIFSFGEANSSKEFSALSDISFEVFKGETIGIIGINGSGKSTLSNILAQVIPPSSGTIEIEGETSLVAISAGLNNQLSGLENIELKCLMHGMKKSEIREITPDIIEFADIGEFINQPIKSYSSGMRSRLGFAISVNIDPDILVIDEALSVGDSTFYQKCLNKFDEYQEQGKTIFFISHSLSQVKNISDRIIWLNFGQIERFDSTEIVANEYSEFIEWFNKLTENKKKEYRQEMLSTQIGKAKKLVSSDGVIEKRSRMNKKHKSTKNKGVVESFQLIFISIIFIFSTLLMFFDNPIGAFIKTEKSLDTTENSTNNLNVENAEELEEVIQVSVNKMGLVSEEIIPVYSDKGFEDKLMDLYFGNEVFVEEEIEDSIYKVEVQGVRGFVNNSDIKVFENEIPKADFSIADFVPLFPERFASSHTFFFSFLGTDINVVKDSLQGLTEENTDQFGHPQLVYGYENTTYKFDEDNISDAIQVDEINMESSLIDEVGRQSIVTLKNDQVYYLLIDNYRVYLDANNEKVTFEHRKEEY